MAGFLQGVDVSEHRRLGDWQVAGLGFVFARASIGTTRDTRYGAHVLKGTTAGLVVGAFHFNVGSLPVAPQVATFLEAAGDVDGYALDVEGDDAFSANQAREFIDRVQQTGRPCGLYHSSSGFPDSSWGARWRWVADWRKGLAEPAIAWDVWQYRGSPLDLDAFDGTAAELRELMGGHMQPLVVSSPAPKIVALSVGDQLLNPDGSPLVKVSVASSKPSPYEVAIGALHYRVVTVLAGGMPTLALWHNEPGSISDPPPSDCAAEIAAAIKADREKATVAVVYP